MPTVSGAGRGATFAGRRRCSTSYVVPQRVPSRDGSPVLQSYAPGEPILIHADFEWQAQTFSDVEVAGRVTEDRTSHRSLNEHAREK